MFLTYAQRFKIVPQQYSLTMPSPRGAFPNPITKMYIVKRSHHADGSRMGDIVPLTNLRAPADLIPLFHLKADKRLTKASLLEYNEEFSLNKFFDLELFFSLELPG